jgi:hypothetical protein
MSSDSKTIDSQPPKVEFFNDGTSKEKTKKTKNVNPIHPFEEYEDFHENPPIPVFNYIINSKTGELIEDKSGKP